MKILLYKNYLLLNLCELLQSHTSALCPASKLYHVCSFPHILETMALSAGASTPCAAGQLCGEKHRTPQAKWLPFFRENLFLSRNEVHSFNLGFSNTVLKIYIEKTTFYCQRIAYFYSLLSCTFS